jgi:hypothetical protein
MFFLKKVNLLVSGLAALALLSCGGDEPAPADNATPVVTCKLAKVNWDNIAPPTPEVMQYNSSGQFVGSGGGSSGAYTRLKYDANGKIIERNIYDRGDALVHISHYKYDGQGDLTKIANIKQDPYSRVIDTIGYTFYTYDAGKRLSYVTTHLRIPYISTGIDSVFYLPNNGIRYKKYIVPPGAAAVLIRTVDYFFDTHKNAYSNSRWFYNNDVTEGDLLPIEHNISSIKAIHHGIDLTVSTSFAYTYNAQDYPVTWTQYNSLYSGVYYSGTYEYTCQ